MFIPKNGFSGSDKIVFEKLMVGKNQNFKSFFAFKADVSSKPLDEERCLVNITARSIPTHLAMAIFLSKLNAEDGGKGITIVGLISFLS